MKRGISRRQFFSYSAALGAGVALPHLMPAGLTPVALADEVPPALAGKEGLRVLGERPMNAETPAHLLGDAITPARHLFIRNNGNPPVNPDPGKWTLEVAGESAESVVRFTIDELKSRFETVSLQLVLECGGNGRSEFDPPVSGNQWSTGAVGCPTWQGVRLADVLKAAGVKNNAVYVAYEGADTHLSGDPSKLPISRGVPLAKAMEPESLIAFSMNDEPIPLQNGYPLRLVVAGYPGSVSGKWLKRILIRDRVHDGPKMTGTSYRVPRYPVAPGTSVPEDDMEIIHAMPVKSLITTPRSRIEHAVNRPLSIAGHAWVGEGKVDTVEVTTDFGQTWQKTTLSSPKNRYAWQQFQAVVSFPGTGYYEVWARATDDAGRTQPMVLPGWNPKGYLNNACHRIAVVAV